MMPPFDTALLKHVEGHHPAILQAKREAIKTARGQRRQRIQTIVAGLLGNTQRLVKISRQSNLGSFEQSSLR